jgi:NAD(P)-dependent dehydrogenase (short-subunit alcohol dehydrogenase family)
MSEEAQLLFPLWQIDQQEYRAVCAHLGITPKAQVYERLSAYLANAPFRFPRPTGFSLFLARPRLTRFRIARLDMVTKLFLPHHPIRHVLNGVIALHECDAEGYRELSVAPVGWAVPLSLPGWASGFVWRLAVSVPWLGSRLLAYAAGAPFRRKGELAAKRILVTGVNRGLGMDLMLHCLEQGGEVVGTVRNAQALEELKGRLPAQAPITLLIANLSRPGALVEALEKAQIPAESLAVAILNAGVKYDGESVLSLANLRDTFQVNFFSAAELATWLCAPATQEAGAADRVALVLVSSMGRWHGMHFGCGYNASKAALSIWGESLDMELRQSGKRRFTVTIVEPGIFESGMSRHTAPTRFLFAARRDVAQRIVSAALAGERAIRPPVWFALLTWAVCLAGRDFRYRLFTRAKPTVDRR